MTDMESHHLPGQTTETVAFAPEDVNYSSSSETLMVESDAVTLHSNVPMESEAHLQESAPHSTLQRLVKPDEVVYEVPAEDKDIDDGQQVLEEILSLLTSISLIVLLDTLELNRLLQKWFAWLID